MSESFLLPVSKSPTKPELDLPKDKINEIDKDIPLMFCNNDETDTIGAIPETPLSKYYLSVTIYFIIGKILRKHNNLYIN